MAWFSSHWLAGNWDGSYWYGSEDVDPGAMSAAIGGTSAVSATLTAVASMAADLSGGVVVVADLTATTPVPPTPIFDYGGWSNMGVGVREPKKRRPEPVRRPPPSPKPDLAKIRRQREEQEILALL